MNAAAAGGTPVHRYRRLMEGLVGVPATEGNEVTILRNGVAIFPAMLDAIQGATSTVDFATYVYWTGDVAERFAKALCDRAQAGVRVRVLLDAVGAMPMDRGLVHAMEEAGCAVEFFREPTKKPTEVNNRCHRKILICDEDVAFTGGVGIAEEWDGDARNPDEWRDTHVRVRGPAVDGIRAAFVENWAESGRELFEPGVDRFPDQPDAGTSIVQTVRGQSGPGWGIIGTAFIALLHAARERIRITSAYFVPTDDLLKALVDATERGVDVHVLVPGEHHDKRVVQAAGEATYAELLAAGVRIAHYERTMLHAKVLTIDGLVACVGSANFDQRSLLLNEEMNLVVFDEAVTAELDAHFDHDLTSSQPIDADGWADRSLLQKATEKAAGVLRSQL